MTDSPLAGRSKGGTEGGESEKRPMVQGLLWGIELLIRHLSIPPFSADIKQSAVV